MTRYEVVRANRSMDELDQEYDPQRKAAIASALIDFKLSEAKCQSLEQALDVAEDEHEYSVQQLAKLLVPGTSVVVELGQSHYCLHSNAPGEFSLSHVPYVKGE